MIHPPTDAMLVPFDGSFRVADYETVPGELSGKKALQKTEQDCIFAPDFVNRR